MSASTSTAWGGPRGPRNREPFSWSGLLWALVFPQRSHRIVPTAPGTVLIALALGIGLAAYNASSNILFLTLSVLLASLILSGVMSWLNLRGVRWRVTVAPALRVGHDTSVTVELRNAKRVLPTYGLWFNFLARQGRSVAKARPETTLTARGLDLRSVFAQVDANELRGRGVLPTRLDAAGDARVDWVFRPTKRGLARVELLSVGSLFPFGFLRKDVGVALGTDVVVWPAPIEYRRHKPAGRRLAGDERVIRAGSGNDLLAVRRYQPGDSHRLIHWKASARTRQLLVRQFSAETVSTFAVWLRTDAALWPRAEQFELLVSFAASLCEDLFRAGSLQSVAIDDQPPLEICGVRDLEQLLNALAVLEPGRPDAALPARGGGNALTFRPDGPRGIVAVVDGQPVATT